MACLLAPASVSVGVAQTGTVGTGTVDFTVNRQQVEGFGFSEAFGAAKSVGYLSPALQAQVWDLMFNPTTGAGLNVLRVGINTDTQIEPNSPGSPTATPTYTFDGSDGNQVQTAQIAQRYGVTNFFATSWSAPPFMKTNNSLINGGSLCGTPGTLGVTGTACTGDWRQAYADFLVQYINFYKGVGVPIGALNFSNEPDFNAVTYASMLMNNNQVIDFIQSAFGPTMRAKAPATRTMCCESINWSAEQVYTGAFPYYPAAAGYTDIITAHEYGYPASFAPATTKPVWMTEWATLNTTDELRWDCGGCSGSPDGIYLANDIVRAFNAGNVSAYTYWWGAVNQSNALVEVYLSLTAPGYYQLTGRYNAMTAISRYVRPGAYRVATSNTDTNVNVVAFRNPDGSKVLELVNNGYTADAASLTVDATTAATAPRTFLTNQTNALTETGSAVIAGTLLSVPLPARSLTTITLAPPAVAGDPQLLLTPTVNKMGDGTYQVILKLTNAGVGTAHGVQVLSASIGAVQGAPTPVSALPQIAGTGEVAPGGYTLIPLNFGANAGASGTTVVERVSGTYTGGTFGGSFRILLP